MKKILSCIFAAVALVAVGCTKDDEEQTNTPQPNPSGDVTEASVVGTWYLQHEDDYATLVLTEEKNYTLLQAFYKEEGSFTVANNTLTLTSSKAWTRDWIRDEIHGGPIRDANGNYQYTEWQETEPYETVRIHQIRMLYEGDVMLMKQIDDHSGEPEEVWAPYVKENATHVSNINDIQGKWYWMMSGEGFSVPRVIVNVEGNQGDIIITPWGERYKGTIRYEKGVIYMDNFTFYTTRYEDGEGGWEHMNDEDPENSDWRIPFGEYPYQPTFGQISMGFVVDGNVAYGGVANLLADFERQ